LSRDTARVWFDHPQTIRDKEGEMRPADRNEIQAIRAELDGLRAQVDAAGSARGRSWWALASGRPRMAKRLTRVGLVALMLALPVVVSASHQFSDVPTSHTFHAAISRLYGARLTSGCTATKFCPNANVTRGQMAAFLNRGLGRASGDWGATGFADDWAAFDDGFLGAIDLLHGGAPGGTGHVLVTANVSAYTDEGGICPCELGVSLVDADSLEDSPVMFQVIQNTPAPAHDAEPAWYETSASVSYLFTVPSGVTHTYVLAASMIPTLSPSPENQAAAEWTISAVYIPFGGDGANPSTTSTEGVEGRRGH
jgi:hypothetical protein